LKIFIKTKGEISLSDNDFIGEGGAGRVYGKDGIAYKIYTNPKNMIPYGKFTELSSIKNDRVIRPIDIILSPKSNKEIGYTMRLLENSVTTPLSQLFTKGFKNRHGLTTEDIVVLIKDMQNTYSDIHSAGCLVIDGNELNFKADNKMDRVYFLDADSFQTPSCAATFQMLNIKDWHQSNGYSQNTDWFAWGIVTFNLLIGIHPFKGFHVVHKDDFVERMKRNISVFSTEVSLPPVVMSLNIIPQTLRDWYKAVFQDGKRIPPPIDYLGSITIVTDVRHINGTDQFDITLIDTANSEIVQHVSIGGITAFLTIDVAQKYKSAVFLSIGDRMGRIFYSYIDQGKIKVADNKGTELSVNLLAEQLMSYEGRIYYKLGSIVYQLNLHETLKSTLVTPRAVANVHERNTRMFDGIALMNLLGTTHAVVFPEKNLSYTIGIKDIKDKVIDAKYENRVAMIVMANKQGKYRRMVLKFAKDHKSYEVFQDISDINYTDLNFVVLDKGICCNINENCEIELFTNQMGNTLMKVISDPMIKSDMRLTKNGDQVMFVQGKNLYSLKTK